MTYADMKFNGKPNLTFSTTDEGHIVLTVTVLPGSYYEKIYSEFRSQDYKTMETAFGGPKNENPPGCWDFAKVIPTSLSPDMSTTAGIPYRWK